MFVRGVHKDQNCSDKNFSQSTVSDIVSFLYQLALSALVVELDPFERAQVTGHQQVFTRRTERQRRLHISLKVLNLVVRVTVLGVEVWKHVAHEVQFGLGVGDVQLHLVLVVLLFLPYQNTYLFVCGLRVKYVHVERVAAYCQPPTVPAEHERVYRCEFIPSPHLLQHLPCLCVKHSYLNPFLRRCSHLSPVLAHLHCAQYRLVRFHYPLCQPVEIHQQQVPVFDTRRRQYQIVRVIAQRYHVVLLVLFELKRLNHMLDLHREQVHNKHLIAQRHYDLVLPDAY
jgi:hypothetical protein